MNLKEKDKQYNVGSYGRFPLEIVKGKGSLCWDENGKEYIDLGAGIAVNAFGFCDDEWTAAVKAQLDTLQHTSNLYYTEPCVTLAEMLCKRSGMSKVFFSNSGAEANECAIKAARRYAFQKYGDESHSTIITLKNSFHGRTVTTLSATGQDSFHTEFGPFTQGFLYAEPNDIDGMLKLINENDCAAVMMEMVLGEGGVLSLDPEFVKATVEAARAKDMLIVVDEVQTGNGRTGALYAYMHYGFTPDIFSTAKGLGGGLPIGATLFSEKTENVYTPGTHGSTFGGNPIACAGAVSVFSRIDDALLAEIKKKSDYIVSELSSAKGVKAVSGKGLMLGIACDRPAKEVISGCMENGVLVISAKDKVRLVPALNIPMDQLKKAIDVLKAELAI